VDSKEIKDLVRFVARADIDEFELETESFRLRVTRRSLQPAPAAVAPVAVPQAAPPPAPAAPAPAAAPEPAGGGKDDGAKAADGLYEQKSPIVGTFYRAPSPGAPPFVEVGQHVSAGQVLCIIEAMKLMNEIESEISGTIVEILPENAQPVEYGEVLFRIRPD